MATTYPEIGPAPGGPWLGRTALAALIVAVIVLLWWAAQQQGTITRKPADSVIVPLMPPPPPPPPPVIEPEIKPEEVPPVPTDQPQPTPPLPAPVAPSNNSPAPSAAPGNAVSIDGPPQAAGDAFNIGSGPGGGARGAGGVGGGIGGFNRAAYTSYLQGEITRIVQADRDLRSSALRVRARIWIDTAGRITRAEIGDAEKAAKIRAALLGRTVRAPDGSLDMPVVFTLSVARAG